MRFREYEVTEQAVKRARSMGVYGDTAKRIARMARRSAPITHELGNWRFQDFILLIENGRVLDVSRLDLSTANP